MRESSMVWKKVAGVLSVMSSSIYAELHALRAGLAASGARDLKRAALPSGAVLKARRASKVRLKVRVALPPCKGVAKAVQHVVGSPRWL